VLGVEGFEGEAAYAAQAWQLSGAGTLTATGPSAGASIEGLTTRWSGTIRGSPERLVVTAGDCVAWQVAALEWRGSRVEGLSSPCLRPGDGDVLLAHDFGTGLTRFAASTTEEPLEVRLVRAGQETAIGGRWPALQISGAVGAEGVVDLNAGVSGGALTLPAENIDIEGVEGSAEIRGGAAVSSTLSVTAIESLATPARWTPVSLRASAKGEGEGLSFDAEISDALGVWVLEAAGRYEDGRATSRVTLYPISFLSGATEIRDLSPFLADYVEDASGTVGFEAEVVWGPEGLQGAGDLSLRDFGATVAGIAVSGVNTSTSFAALLPPATLPEQRAEIGRIDLGVPLERGVVVYELESGGPLAVSRLAFDLAGGRVYAEPFTVDSAEVNDIGFVLRAEEVELAQMLALSRIEGLQGTGVLSGRIPVRMSDRGLQLDEGILAAETDGVLRYTPENLPAFLQGDDLRSRMLREALTNFHYEELSVTVASESGENGEQRLTLNAQGANPDFLEGHPIELNFDFQGPLLGAMRSAVDVSGAGEIEDMFEQQESGIGEIAQ
jgi:hypothetical protein